MKINIPKQFTNELRFKVEQLQAIGFQAFLKDNKIFILLFAEHFEVKTQGQMMQLMNREFPSAKIFNNI